MRLDRVGCVTNAENDRSVAVARRLGMNVVAEADMPREDGRGTAVAVLLVVCRDGWTSHQNPQGTHAKLAPAALPMRTRSQRKQRTC
jgi:hypothetical protein